MTTRKCDGRIYGFVYALGEKNPGGERQAEPVGGGVGLELGSPPPPPAPDQHSEGLDDDKKEDDSSPMSNSLKIGIPMARQLEAEQEPQEDYRRGISLGF